MAQSLYISGFADDIAEDFQTRLECLRCLGLRYLCFRVADGKGLADDLLREFAERILPQTETCGLRISGLGTPLGIIDLQDEAAYEKQTRLLERFCAVANIAGCRFLRIFSFFIPKKENTDLFPEHVVAKLKLWIAKAERAGCVLLHENEKGIFGDLPARCLALQRTLDSPCFKAAFDVADFVQCGTDPADAYELLKSYVAEIHIKDALFENGRNVLCGRGDGKSEELLARFVREEKYEGIFTLEPHCVDFAALQYLERSEGHPRKKAERVQKHGLYRGAVPENSKTFSALRGRLRRRSYELQARSL